MFNSQPGLPSVTTACWSTAGWLLGFRGGFSCLATIRFISSPGSALEEYVDALVERAGTNVRIQIKLTQIQVRFAPRVEQYLFRIVQQACENALRHAQARTIDIYGALDATYVKLTVADNGIGFSARTSFDLSTLLAHKHFGLVGMYERASIIGAKLSVTSTPGQGTRETIVWKPDKDQEYPEMANGS